MQRISKNEIPNFYEVRRTTSHCEGRKFCSKSIEFWPDTRKRKMLPLFLDLHDAYLLCSCEQLDFIAAYGEAAEYEYEKEY